MIVPDIQNYTNNEDGSVYLNTIADFYNANRERIHAIFQVGDLTNNKMQEQYENAYKCFFNKFSWNEQMVFCLGNHDYGKNGSSDARESNIPDYMMPSYDSKMEGTHWDNYVRYITVGGKRYGVLVLEFCTRNETLDWANKIIMENDETPFIILTHAFLNVFGQLFDYTDKSCNNDVSPKAYKMGEEYKNDSMEIFNKIIWNNPNVEMVICGHSLAPEYIKVLSKDNIVGKKVNIIMVNYQHYRNGGDGFVGLLSFSKNKNSIYSFSTMEGRFGDVKILF